MMYARRLRRTFVFCLSTFIALMAIGLGTSSAQNDSLVYTDYIPFYIKWQDNYIIDKVEYTVEEMIIYFRFRDDNESLITFYGPQGQYAWYLSNSNDKTEAYHQLAVKNIRHNNKMVRELLTGADEARFKSFAGDVFTCQIHFKRLPNTLISADLIEGKGAETNKNHFNCFDIQIKQFDDPLLGRETDMLKNIESFKKGEKVLIQPTKDMLGKTEEDPDLVVPKKQELDLTESQFAEKMLELVNQMRAEGCACGRVRYSTAQPVTWNAQAALTAKKFTEHLWENNAMTTDDDGSSTIERLKLEGSTAIKAYEIVSHGSENILTAFAGWKGTPPHCSKIMDKKVVEIGAAQKGAYWSLILILKE